MAIGKRVEIEWNGQTYDIDINMRLINRVEDDVNLLKLAQRLSVGDVPASHVATVFYLMLKNSGAKVTIDAVWEAMFKSGESENIVKAASMALQCFFPDVETPPNSGEVDAKK